MSYFTLILVAVTMVIFFRWTVKTYEPIVFENIPFPISSQEVKQGEYLDYQIKYCKKMEEVPVITKTFVDSIVYSIPQEPQPFLKMGCQTENIKIYIPKALPEGEYVIKSTYAVKVNPIRTVNVYTETQPFTVISK